MPGAIFYDVWIKTGHLIAPATACAIAALMSGRVMYCGLFVGFALLDKESAVFSCLAIVILSLLDSRHRNARTIAAILLTAALTSAWWYIIFSATVNFLFQFSIARNNEGVVWTYPWNQYIAWLWEDAGTAGCALLALGALCACAMRRRQPTPSADAPYAWWPLAIVVPTYLVLSVLPGKAPWVLFIDYPAIATLQAIGVVGLGSTLERRHRRLGTAWLVLVAATIAVMAWRSLAEQYDVKLQRMVPLGWENAERTRALARAVNCRIGAEEKLLTTTMGFNTAPVFDMHSPIFVYYVSNVWRLTMSCTGIFDHYALAIVTDRLDWALFSPPSTDHATAITNGFKTRYNLEPIILDGGSAFLYRTKGMYGQKLETRNLTLETDGEGLIQGTK